MKNKKRKEIEVFYKKKCYRLETFFSACKERNVGLEVESVSVQEIIKDCTKEVAGLQDKVEKLKQNKEKDASDTSNLKNQIKDQKEKYEQKEIEHEKLNKENQ